MAGIEFEKYVGEGGVIREYQLPGITDNDAILRLENSILTKKITERPLGKDIRSMRYELTQTGRLIEAISVTTPCRKREKPQLRVWCNNRNPIPETEHLLRKIFPELEIVGVPKEPYNEIALNYFSSAV